MPLIETEDTVDKVIKEWRPTARQEDFLQIPFSVFEALYGGALGGGKSDVLVMLPLVYGFHRHPLFHGILFRESYPQLEASLISRAKDKWYRPLIQAGYCSYNETKHVITFKSGAKLRFGFMEKDADAREHDTNEYHYIGIDEASQQNEFRLRFIPSRLRTTTKDLPVIYRLGSNPGGPGHVYLRDRFVKPCPGGNVILKDLKTKQSRIFIPSKLQDNPHLMNEDPNYINRLQMLPEGEREAKMNGDWFAFSGQVFSEFRSERNFHEPENAFHVVSSKTEIPEWWPKIVAIDWGMRAKAVVLCGAITPDDRLIVFYQYARKNELISTWASNVARDLQYIKNIKGYYLDPSAWQKRGDDKTIEQQISLILGTTCRKADNDRFSGKLLVHEYLRWEHKPKSYVPPEGFSKETSDRILRLYGTKAQDDYVSLFKEQKEETNIPKLLITDNCQDLIETIKQCQYPENKRDNLPIEDVMEFDGDDAYDCLRYLLKGTRSYFEEAKEENEKRRKLGDAVADVMRTNDWTAYASRLRTMNVNNKKETFTIRRRNDARRFH